MNKRKNKDSKKCGCPEGAKGASGVEGNVKNTPFYTAYFKKTERKR